MATAAARGWGAGWPDCQRDRCVWIAAGGIRLLVRAEVAPIFKGFCDELVQRGYPLGNVADDWGFACRPIRGTTSSPSNHSWGLAIDLNSTANPMGSTLVTDFPDWAIELGEQKYGLSWGGRYCDAMHWEWLGTPDQAAWLIAALAALPASEQPPEPPAQEDDMPKVYEIEGGAAAHPDGGSPWFVNGQVRWWIPTGAHHIALANVFGATLISPIAWDVIRATTVLNIDGLLDDGGDVVSFAGLSDADVSKIAAAVADEQARRLSA